MERKARHHDQAGNTVYLQGASITAKQTTEVSPPLCLIEHPGDAGHREGHEDNDQPKMPETMNDGEPHQTGVRASHHAVSLSAC